MVQIGPGLARLAGGTQRDSLSSAARLIRGAAGGVAGPAVL